MKHVALSGRLFLRKILTMLSLGAVSFIFHACYGMPMTSSISGKVRDNDTKEPITGIQVSIKENPKIETVKTDNAGWFDIWLDGLAAPYTILFQDVDGPKNGEYEDTEVHIESYRSFIDVFMDRKADVNDQ